jgi:hypothetical protein
MPDTSPKSHDENTPPADKPKVQRGVDRPSAQHEDELSPTQVRRDTATKGGQRIGNNTAVDNPDVSFPDPEN